MVLARPWTAIMIGTVAVRSSDVQMCPPSSHYAVSLMFVLLEMSAFAVVWRRMFCQHGDDGCTFGSSSREGREESGTVEPSMPGATSTSNPVRDEDRTKASSLSPLDGRLSTKTFSNWTKSTSAFVSLCCLCGQW